MSSPAGFLTFQGHNALDAAFQWIDVDFSYDKTKSMTFSDDKKDTEPERASFQKCNYTTSDSFVHGFEVTFYRFSSYQTARATTARTAATPTMASSIPNQECLRASTGYWCCPSGRAPSPWWPSSPTSARGRKRAKISEDYDLLIDFMDNGSLLGGPCLLVHLAFVEVSINPSLQASVLQIL